MHFYLPESYDASGDTELLREGQRGRRSAFQHKDIEFHKEKTEEGELPRWKVMHKGEHVGHMTQDTEEHHVMSGGRYNHSVGRTQNKTYAYHHGTKMPKIYGHNRRNMDVFLNKDDLSRTAARMSEKDKS